MYGPEHGVLVGFLTALVATFIVDRIRRRQSGAAAPKVPEKATPILKATPKPDPPRVVPGVIHTSPRRASLLKAASEENRSEENSPLATARPAAISTARTSIQNRYNHPALTKTYHFQILLLMLTHLQVKQYKSSLIALSSFSFFVAAVNPPASFSSPTCSSFAAQDPPTILLRRPPRQSRLVQFEQNKWNRVCVI
jgi:hypothetical protein